MNTEAITLLQEQSQIFVTVNPGDSTTTSFVDNSNLHISAHFDLSSHAIVLNIFNNDASNSQTILTSHTFSAMITILTGGEGGNCGFE